MLNQRDKGRRNQQFVRNGIEKHTQRRDLAALSGKIAVQEVRQRCCQKDPRGNQHMILSQQYGYQQWHREDADQGQCIRKIHGR